MRLLVLGPAKSGLESLVVALEEALDGDGETHVVETKRELLRQLALNGEHDVAIVDCDVGDAKGDGMAIIAAVRALDPEIPIIAVAKVGSVALAKQAVDAGASDFLVRGQDMVTRAATLLVKTRRTLDLIDHKRGLLHENAVLAQRHSARDAIVGQSPQILALIGQLRRVARLPRPVLITGERGTGKELIARALHEESPRAEARLLTVNCAAFSDSLLENELFGHERGGFSGADKRARGLFELAHGGTLFLDEISNTTLSFQQKILRVVEYGRFTRVGGAREIESSARVVAATNVDLKQRIADKLFLPDLYDRLAFEVIHVPPLRQRPGDVPILAEHFLRQFMVEVPELAGKRLSAESLAELCRYDFPGNVRELKTIIERATYRVTSEEITPADMGLQFEVKASRLQGGFHIAVEKLKRDLIADALKKTAGNQTAAAKLLDLSYDQFRHFRRKYGAG